jgi:RNA polymerase-binding transcription factor DksA
MANVKPGADKGGKKSASKTASKATKSSSKTASAPANKAKAARNKTAVASKIKPTAAKPPAKAKAAAPKAVKKPAAATPAAKKPLKAAPAAKAVVKNIKKPSAPVKEKSTEKAKAVKAPEASPKKKVAEAKVEAPAPVAKPAEKKAAAKQVKMPKITTTSAVPYEPDFTHSVLDTPREEPAEAPSTPSLRYSDMELLEFKNLIQRKLDAAKKELAYLQGLITRKDETGGDADDGRYMTMEDGSLSMEREQLSQMASRQITFIDHLEKALMRIENKTYGICRVTGKLIEKARLRAVPHATLSMEAKTSKTMVG